MTILSSNATRIMYELRDLDANELRNIEHTARHYQKQLNRKKLQSEKVHVGSLVQFTATQTGLLVKGRIIKINQKTVSVKGNDFLIWRVPPSMLFAAESEQTTPGQGVEK